MSLCACHCPWTPKAPRCSQGKPEGDEVTSSPSSGAAGAWVILEAVGSRVGSRILEGPTLGSPLPSTAPDTGVSEGRGGSKAGPANEETPSS